MPRLLIGQRIGAFDPGYTTGFAAGWYTGNGQFNLEQAIEIRWDARFDALIALVPTLDWIIYERFALYASHMKDQINSEFPSVQFIGALQLAAYMAGKSNRLVVQPASERRQIKVLSEHQDFVTGSQHKRDAYQHLRLFCLLNKRSVS
jgi:hypothetical protein